VFTDADRERIRRQLLERAEADARIVAAAETGSLAGGSQDAWSDIDLAFALADDADLEAVLREWTKHLELELAAVHYWDLTFRGSVARVFLLADGLEVDLVLSPQTEFGPRGPAFRIVFGKGKRREAASVDANQLAGLGWHHLLHARAAI
jgi:predicted nucleotidyltransferase